MALDILERLRDAVDFLDLEGWLDQYCELKSGGGNERRLQVCPKCANDEYKLYVNVEKKRWLCYVCGYGQHLADVTVLMADVSGRTLFDIRRELLEEQKPAPTGDLVQLLERQFAPPPPELPVIPEVVLPGDDNFSGLLGQQVLAYCYDERGMTPDEAGLYRIRVARRLRRFDGPYVVFPAMYKGRVVGWQGRNIRDVKEAKYVSSDDVADWIWPLDDLFLAELQYNGRISLVEGVFDVQGMRRIGEPTFASYGKKISPRQIDLMRRIGIKHVNLMWDADAAVTSDKKLARGDYKRGLRGEIEEGAMKLRQYFGVSVTDLSNPPVIEGCRKPDPGEIMRVPAVADWIRSRMATAMDVNSLEFFQWRLGG